MNYRDTFPTFATAVAARLEEGAKLYGDRSFTLPLEVLADEIEQELLDVCAWSFVLWCRLRGLRERMP